MKNNTDLQKQMAELLKKYYKQAVSDSIKRGLYAKKLQGKGQK